MAKDPAVLFYTSDFLSGTAFFTDSQRGQYIRLLCEQHQLYSIPENHMISVCGSLESPVVKKFAKDEDGSYYNTRMREEAIKRANYCKSRGNNKKGASKKKIISKSYEKHMENENENENINDKKRGSGGKTKHSFEKSPYFDFDHLKESLPGWSEEKCRHYHNAAIEYSGAHGKKYLDWRLAIMGWDRKSPFEERTKSGRGQPRTFQEADDANRAAALKRDQDIIERWRRRRSGSQNLPNSNRAQIPVAGSREGPVRREGSGPGGGV